MNTLDYTLIEVERPISNYEVNNQMARKIGDTLNKVKGRVDQQLSQSGKLDTNEFIKFRLDRKTKQIPDFNIFDETIEKNGLDVYFVLDCSLSMYYAEDNLRNIASTIFKALENCSFIRFHAIGFSGSFNGCLYYQDIKKVDDCKYITADRTHRGTPTHYILDYIHKKIRKMDNKKLVILFTDGLPEDTNSYDQMQEDIKKQIVKMRNDKISFFTIFFKNHKYNKSNSLTNDITQKMRDMFKHGLYETDDFDQVQKIMIKQLIKSVERINQNV